MPVQKKVTKKEPKEQEYVMPVEVALWIEEAQSRIRRLASEVDRLKREVSDLKAYKKFAEQRLTRPE